MTTLDKDSQHTNASGTDNKAYGENYIFNLINKIFKKSPQTEKIPSEDGTKIIEKYEIPETPFTAVKLNDQWFLMMGKYRLSQTPFKTLKETLIESENVNWDRVLQVIQIMITANDNQKAKIEEALKNKN